MNIGNKKKSGSFLGNLKSTRPLGIFMSSLYGLLISLGIGLALTLLVSAILYSLDDPGRYVTPTAIIVLYVSALMGGFITAKLCGGSALLCGGLYSLMMLVLMFVVSLLFGDTYSSEYSLPLAVGLRGIALALALFGAVTGAKQPTKKRKRNR